MRGSIFFIILALIFIIFTTSVLIFNINSPPSLDNRPYNSDKPAIIIPTGNIVQEDSPSIEITNTTNTFKPANPKTYNVEITNFAFSPAELTIKRGDSVIWVNRDYTEHKITSDSGELDSGYLKEGKIYDHVFDTVGTFHYYSSFYPSMTGKIIVE
jgi:plastocyanin